MALLAIAHSSRHRDHFPHGFGRPIRGHALFHSLLSARFGIRVLVSLFTLSVSRIFQMAAFVLCTPHSICPCGLIPALALATWHAWYFSKVPRFLVLHACASNSRFWQLIPWSLPFGPFQDAHLRITHHFIESEFWNPDFRTLKVCMPFTCLSCVALQPA